jgi:hypothetical protein
MMTLATAGSTGGAALLWVVGMIGLLDLPNRLPDEWAASQAAATPAVALAALAWTILIAGYLAWTSLTRHDENRLVDELDAAYGAPPGQPTP